jgi:predicted transposase YdaD
MGQPDLAIRLLAERHAADLLPALLRDREVRVVGVERSEVKVVERITDQVVLAHVDGELTVIHVEFQVRHEEDIPWRVLAYHALLRHRYFPLPVRSIVVYLMHRPPSTPLPRGVRSRAGDPQLDFVYEVFCPWEVTIAPSQVERTPALAPIATLTAGFRTSDLARVRAAVEHSDLPSSERVDLLAVTYFIAGRRFPDDLLQSVLWSRIMEDSSTYRYVISKGRAEGLAEGRTKGEAAGLRRAILDLVEARLGQIPEGLDTALDGHGAEELQQVFSRMVRASDAEALRAALPRG